MAAKSRRKALNIAQRGGWSDRVVTVADVRAVHAGYYFDPEMAQRAVDFIEKCLVHTKGSLWAGKPFILLPWQKRFIEDIFGWMTKAGYRRFKRAFLEIAKKNGKSTLAAACMLLLLILDAEPSAEVYTAAMSRKQAKIVFNHCAAMAEDSPPIARRVNVIHSTARIVYPETRSFIEALSREAATQEGLDIHGAVLDELHIHTKRDLYETLEFGGVARTQPLHLEITTAGVYDPESIGYEQHEYAERVISGEYDDMSFHATIYTVPEKVGKKEVDWKDSRFYHLANPSMGHIFTLESIKQDAEKAINDPRKQNAFCRYRLNRWVEAAVQWMTAEAWATCDTSITSNDLLGLKVYAGLDLASTDDIAALALQAEDDDGTIRQIEKFYLPESVVEEKSKHKNRALYRRWADDGHLTVTPTRATDYQYIEDDIDRFNEEFNIQEIAMDPHNATYFANRMIQKGYQMSYVRQTPLALSPPMKEWERRIKERKFAYDGNPVMDWCVRNCAVKEDNRENIFPIKPSRASKIDGVIATLCALSRLCVNEEEDSDVSDAYEDHGVLSGVT